MQNTVSLYLNISESAIFISPALLPVNVYNDMNLTDRF